MFFFFSKLLVFLIQPLNWIVFLFVFALFSKNSRSKRRALRTGAGLLIFFTSPLIAGFTAKMYEASAVAVQDLPTYEYGLVLGGFSDLEGENNTDRLNLGIQPNRLTHALDLYRQGKIRKFLLSGGDGRIIGGGENEAVHTAAYLRRLRVPESDIIIESKARNTYENFLYSKKMLAAEGSGKILVITSAFHVPRSRLIAKKAGLKADFYATDFFYKKMSASPYRWILPDDRALIFWKVILKEWVGIAAYKAKGYI